MGMNDINSLSHSKLNCKYHIVFAPKYRRKVFYKKTNSNRKNTAGIMRMEGCEDHRGRSMSRTHSPVCRDPTEVFRIRIHGISEGKKCSNDV